MKKSVLFSTSIAISILAITSCNSPVVKEIPVSEAKTEVKVKKDLLAENKAEVEMNVEGMVCAMGCAKFIEDKVADLNGIVLSQVDFENGKAKFEFDKTELTAQEIEEYINNIHDGQYKAKIASSKVIEAEVETSSNEDEESLGSVKERINNISLPKLFTYFLKSIR